MKTIEQDIPLKSLQVDHVKGLSQALGEPAWVLELRVKAFENYSALPWPGPKDEAWRKTDLKQLKWDSLQFSPSPSGEAAPSIEESFKGFFEEGPANGHTPAKATIHLQKGTAISVPDNVKKTGAEWLTLKEAIQKHPDKIKTSWSNAIEKAKKQKFLLLTLAVAQEGLCLFLPANQKGAVPFKVIQNGARQGDARFGLNFVFAGKGSENQLWEEMAGEDSGESSTPAYVSTYSHVQLEDNAKLSFVRLQHWPDSVNYFHFRQIDQARDSRLNTVSVDVGGKLFRNESTIDLIGENAENKVLGVLFGDDKQIFENWITQNHRARLTNSDIQYRGVLQGKARSFFSGMVDIVKSAQQSDAYQSFKGLLLSSEAEAEAIPNLEILADDVKCAHGAAVGPVDEDQKYYLQTRGVPPVEAEKIIIQGFFEPVISAVPSETVQEKLREFVEKKLKLS